jgi:hypothetical protein
LTIYVDERHVLQGEASPTDRNLCVARPGLRSVESEGRREASIGIDLPFQISSLLLRGGDGVGAGDGAARRRLLAGNRDERACELGRVAGSEGRRA